FHCLFGTVKLKTFKVLDVIIVSFPQLFADYLINDIVDVFRRGIESGANKRGQVL
ncbi:hypothetical protein BJ138DRAFT_971299, partial [Hygrophoropsis aurantiaca]